MNYDEHAVGTKKKTLPATTPVKKWNADKSWEDE